MNRDLEASKASIDALVAAITAHQLGQLDRGRAIRAIYEIADPLTVAELRGWVTEADRLGCDEFGDRMNERITELMGGE